MKRKKLVIICWSDDIFLGVFDFPKRYYSEHTFGDPKHFSDVLEEIKKYIKKYHGEILQIFNIDWNTHYFLTRISNEKQQMIKIKLSVRSMNSFY